MPPISRRVPYTVEAYSGGRYTKDDIQVFPEYEKEERKRQRAEGAKLNHNNTHSQSVLPKPQNLMQQTVD